jgi:hypothetical protein
MRGIIMAMALSCALSACTRSDDPNGNLGKNAQASSDDTPALRIYVGADGVTTIRAGETSSVDEGILDDATILLRAETFHGKYPHGRVLLESHPAALHGRTVRVVEILRDARIESVAVNAAPR